jgi:hypothetical protein
MGDKQLSTDMENHVSEEKIVETPPTPTPTPRELMVNMRANASYFLRSNASHSENYHKYIESVKRKMKVGKCTVEIKVPTNSQSDCEYSLDVFVLDKKILDDLLLNSKALDLLLNSKGLDALPLDSRLGVLSGLNYKNVHTLGLNKCKPYVPVLKQFPNVDTLLFESIDCDDMIFILEQFPSLESIFISGCDMTPCQLSEIFKYCTGKEIHISANYSDYIPIKPTSMEFSPDSMLPFAEFELLPKLEIFDLKYNGPIRVNPKLSTKIEIVSIESPSDGGDIQFAPFEFPSLRELTINGNLKSKFLENSLPNLKKLHINGAGCCQAFGTPFDDMTAKIYKFKFLPIKCLEGVSIKCTDEIVTLELPCADRSITVKYLHRDFSTSDEYDSATFKYDLHQGPIVLNYRHGKQPTATKLMLDQQLIANVPIPMTTTVPDYTISTSTEQYYPKKLHDLLFVARIYNIATERLFTESIFLEELYNGLFRAKGLMSSSMMFGSPRPTFCLTWVNGLEVRIETPLYSILEITYQMNILQQLMNQKNSFGKKLEKENCYVKDVIHKYCKLGKNENLLQSGYLATIETIESTSQGIQKVWCSYLEIPVVSEYFPEIVSQRCKSFAAIFAAIFDIVISLNKDCNSPNIWSYHIEMEELMEKLQSFSTVGV